MSANREIIAEFAEAARNIADALAGPERRPDGAYTIGDAIGLGVSGAVDAATGVAEVALGGPLAPVGVYDLSWGIAAMGMSLGALFSGAQTRSQMIDAWLDWQDATEVDAVEALDALEYALEKLSETTTDPATLSMITDMRVEVSIARHEAERARHRERDPGRASPDLRDNPRDIHDRVSDGYRDPVNVDHQRMHA